MKDFVQIGVFVPRKINGTFMSSVPLYAELELEKSGLTKTQESAIKDVADFFIEKLNESETAKLAV